MRITVLRFCETNDATLSFVGIDGRFQCFGLEDEQRAFKIPGETRIPQGLYPIRVKSHGGFHTRYSHAFTDFHRGMLEICNIPHFTDVLIHIGNNDDDTAGCLLVGGGCNTIGELTLAHSRVAYSELYLAVIDAAIIGELEIEFIDGEY